MRFCSKCENMYYIRIDSEDTNKLIYYCRHCGNEEDNLLNEYSVDDDYRAYNAHVNIYKAKIDILMEILQND